MGDTQKGGSRILPGQRFLEFYRPALGKTAWTIRLRRLLKTQKAQTVAKRKFQNFKKVCKAVYQRKGAHSGL